jgi:type 1 glutamine amidotransferase
MTQRAEKLTRRTMIRNGAAGAAAVAGAAQLRAALLLAPDAEQPLPISGETLPAKPQAGTIRALLVGGGSSHDFETYFHMADSATLKATGGIVTAYTANAGEAIAQLTNADVLVFSANHASFGTPEFQKALNAFADAGHGVVICHAADWYNWPDAPAYNQRFVGGGARSHGRGEFTVFNRQPGHAVMRNVPAEFKIIDEQYRVAFNSGAPVDVLAETSPEAESGQAYASVWIAKDPKARIVNIALGHANEAHGNPAYQALLVNAVRWVSVRPVEIHPAVPTPSTMERDPGGWTDLLADESLSHWKITAYAGKPLKATSPWTMNKSTHILECDGTGAVEMFLYDKVITDGTFHVEWRLRPVDGGKGYNSGVFMRNSADGVIWQQAQVGDRNVGNLFGQTRVNGTVKGFNVNDHVTQMGKPPGEWNIYEITAIGKEMTLWINGAITATWHDCEVLSGLVGLEAEGFFIEFRNVKFKPA